MRLNLFKVSQCLVVSERTRQYELIHTGFQCMRNVFGAVLVFVVFYVFITMVCVILVYLLYPKLCFLSVYGFCVSKEF